MWFMQVLFDFTMFFHLPRYFQNNCIFVMHFRLKLEKFWISSEVWSRPACSNILQYDIYIYTHASNILCIFVSTIYTYSYTYIYTMYTLYIYICMYTDVYTSSNGVGIKWKGMKRALPLWRRSAGTSNAGIFGLRCLVRGAVSLLSTFTLFATS